MRQPQGIHKGDIIVSLASSPRQQNQTPRTLSTNHSKQQQPFNIHQLLNFFVSAQAHTITKAVLSTSPSQAQGRAWQQQ